MKKYLLIAICLTTTVSYSQHPVYDTIRYAKEYYGERLALFKKEEIKKHGVIFLGNSLTEFGDWKKLLNDSTVINRGIAGDNTFGIIDRLDDVIVRQPRKLFVEVGINDISQNIPASIIAENIISIIESVRKRSTHTKIYVLSVVPPNDNVKKEYPDAFNKDNQIEALNLLLLSKAKENDFTYVDLFSELIGKNKKLDPKYAESDGLHLNQAGYEVWIRLLKTTKSL